MSTVAEIVAAAANLDEEQFSVLRLELDRIERERWDRESAATSAEFERAVSPMRRLIDWSWRDGVVKVVLDTMMWVSWCTLRNGYGRAAAFDISFLARRTQSKPATLPDV